MWWRDVAGAPTAHLPELVPGPLQRLRRLYIPGRRPGQEGTAEASRRNIESHYDLSNDFFELFLDPTLTHSSAFFGPGDTLAQAQGRKIGRMLDLTGTGPGPAARCPPRGHRRARHTLRR